MTSLNNHSLRDTRGSALVVTILLVSVMLAAALILLQRIIPYAKNVRWMNDSAQAYYTARGEVEKARLAFFTGNGGILTSLGLPSLFWLLSLDYSASNDTSGIGSAGQLGDIWCEDTFSTVSGTSTPGCYFETITEDDIPRIIRTLALPSLSKNSWVLWDYVVSSANRELPQKIRLFATDADPVSFGTSKRDKEYHTLDPNNSGGLRFDFRGVDTATNFWLKLKFKDPVGADTSLTIKMQYSYNGVVKTFTNDYTITSADTEVLFATLNTLDGTIQTIAADGTITALDTQSLDTFLNFNCSDTDICSLSLSIDGTTPLDFQLISTGTASLPDLNAVVVGDGLSDNGLYFQRAIDLIPTPQDI